MMDVPDRDSVNTVLPHGALKRHTARDGRGSLYAGGYGRRMSTRGGATATTLPTSPEYRSYQQSLPSVAPQTC